LSLATPAVGPIGAAALPPVWLARRALPLVKLPQGTRLFRVHQIAHGAIFFGPAVDPATGKRQPPTHRFDSLSGVFGVLYAGQRFEGAFVETVLRNPQLRLVSEKYVTARAVSELTCSRELRLAGLHGRGLSRVGLTNAISTGPYAPCWAWSDYLWSHQDKPDGVAYTSRHNPQQICFAIFERPDFAFTAGTPTAFATVLPTIKGLLRQYGKILTRA
jgi:hypothetical protein